MTQSADASAVKSYLSELQDRITAALENTDSVKFRRDVWERPEGGGGESRILSDGAIFERAGVSVSHVFGDKMPPSASSLRPEIAGARP
jgi:coproporphyrinogen III oxidase